MRTTVNIPDELLRRARLAAAERRCSLAGLVTDALRGALAAPDAARKRRAVKLPTYRGRGLRPGVELDSTAELLDLMEGRR